MLAISSVSVWAAEEETWHEETPMPTARGSLTASVVGNKIYTIGGDGSVGRVNTVEIYDTKTNTWTVGKSMPTARSLLTSSVVGNKIYAIGGYNSTGVVVGTVEIYDTETDTWTTGKSMPTAKGNLTSSAVGDKIYVIGGIDLSKKSTNTVDIYDTKTNTWTIGKSKPTATFAKPSSAVGDKIYVIGGKTSGSLADLVEIYDTKTNTWTMGKSKPQLCNTLSSLVVDDKIYAICVSVDFTGNIVEIYDTKTNTWTTCKPSPSRRSFLSSCAVGDNIYVIGGEKNNILTGEMTSLQVRGFSDISPVRQSVLLNTGESVQLSTSYDLANNTNLKWSSTNEAIATVDTNGKVTAVSEGTADIYVKNADGTFKEYISVKVVKGVADELRLAVHLKVGENAKLYLTDDASKVKWSSMDESIATISADGKITAVKKGLVIIKGELEGKSYQIYVRVNNNEI